jgi:hypothetical protein
MEALWLAASWRNHSSRVRDSTADLRKLERSSISKERMFLRILGVSERELRCRRHTNSPRTSKLILLAFRNLVKVFLRVDGEICETESRWEREICLGLRMRLSEAEEAPSCRSTRARGWLVPFDHGHEPHGFDMPRRDLAPLLLHKQEALHLQRRTHGND